MIRLLRRETVITTGLAPPPSSTTDVDVSHTPQRSGPAAGQTHPPDVCPPAPGSAPAAADNPAVDVFELWQENRLAEHLPEPEPYVYPVAPLDWRPGTCYHAAHVDIGNDRYGLLVDSDTAPTRATLLRCVHLNPDGR